MYAHGMRFAGDAFGSVPEAAQVSWAKVSAHFVAALPVGYLGGG